MWKPSTDPVIITCALTGGIHGKEANPNLPEQPDEIVQLTTGGAPRLSVEERLNTVLLSPEMCSHKMGLLNFFIQGEPPALLAAESVR